MYSEGRIKRGIWGLVVGALRGVLLKSMDSASYIFFIFLFFPSFVFFSGTLHLSLLPCLCVNCSIPRLIEWRSIHLFLVVGPVHTSDRS